MICDICSRYICSCDDVPLWVCEVCRLPNCEHYISLASSQTSESERCCSIQSLDEFEQWLYDHILEDEPMSLDFEIQSSNEPVTTSTNNSLVPEPDTEESKVSKSEVVTFADANAGESIRFIKDSTMADSNMGAELARFLSRPVLVSTITWTEGTAVDAFVYPWREFFNDARIKKKLDNFAFLKSTMKIKIMINASPFYYGAALVAYRPLLQFDPGRIGAILPTGFETVAQSQRPHVWIYPQSSAGAEMELPFLYYKNWLEVQNLSDFTNMGELRVISPRPLLNANGVAGAGVTIQIYAWAENVEIAGPTVELALQSSDEYSYTGPVSAPASAISHIAGLLEKAPVIGRFATATRMISSTVADVAAWFGFTNSPVIEDVKPFKGLPFHSFASTEISAPVEKLTLDPKNEVTIDPRVTGAPPEDPMLISHIVTKETFLDAFDWTQAQAVDTLIFGSLVKPDLQTNYTDGVGVVNIHRTPMCQVARMFSHWRGDIIFRIKIVCSQYHRGRLRLTWDPIGDIVADPLSSSVAYTRIIDISEESDIVIKIPYVQARPWLETNSSGTDQDFGAVPPGRSSLRDNGTMTLRVFTALTSPVASADVQVFFYAYAGDNLQYAGPRDIDQNVSFFFPQSQDETIPAMEEDGSAAIISMGEAVTSLRQLMRRTCLLTVLNQSSDTTSAYAIWKNRQGRFPISYGYDFDGKMTATSIMAGADSPFNFVRTIPLTHMAPCYVGYRGSINWHYNLDGPQAIGSMTVMRYRTTRDASNYNSLETEPTATIPDGRTRDLLFNAYEQGGNYGLSVTNQRTQTGLSVQVPMYSSYRMLRCDSRNSSEGNSIDGSNLDSLLATFGLTPDGGNNPLDFRLMQFVSIGTDFSLNFFLNVPTQYVYTSVPFAV